MGNLWPEEKMRRWVTLYTDAGWKDGRARCGFIARGSVPPVWLEGSGECNCDSSAAAEAVAVLHGLRQVVSAFEVPSGLEGVFLRSDNQQVIDSLRGHWEPGHDVGGSGDTRRALKGVVAFCTEHDLRLLVKHVRGHGRANDRVRRWMNARADRLGNMRGR